MNQLPGFGRWTKSSRIASTLQNSVRSRSRVFHDDSRAMSFWRRFSSSRFTDCSTARLQVTIGTSYEIFRSDSALIAGMIVSTMRSASPATRGPRRDWTMRTPRQTSSRSVGHSTDACRAARTQRRLRPRERRPAAGWFVCVRTDDRDTRCVRIAKSLERGSADADGCCSGRFPDPIRQLALAIAARYRRQRPAIEHDDVRNDRGECVGGRDDEAVEILVVRFAGFGEVRRCIWLT